MLFKIIWSTVYYLIRIVDSGDPKDGEPELIASFSTIEEAQRVAQSAQRNDPKNRDEYLVTTDPEALISAFKEQG